MGYRVQCVATTPDLQTPTELCPAIQSIVQLHLRCSQREWLIENESSIKMSRFNSDEMRTHAWRGM